MAGAPARDIDKMLLAGLTSGAGGSAFAAFASLPALPARRTGGGGLCHRRALLVATLLAGVRTVRTGDGAAGKGEGAEKQGDAAGPGHGDRGQQAGVSDVAAAAGASGQGLLRGHPRSGPVDLVALQPAANGCGERAAETFDTIPAKGLRP